jgi:hypothetical protein
VFELVFSEVLLEGEKSNSRGSAEMEGRGSREARGSDAHHPYNPPKPSRNPLLVRPRDSSHALLCTTTIPIEDNTISFITKRLKECKNRDGGKKGRERTAKFNTATCTSTP